MSANAPDSLVDDIIAYESGSMDEDAVVAFFQRLLDTGTVYHLQGSYQRAAQAMLDAGVIHKETRT